MTHLPNTRPANAPGTSQAADMVHESQPVGPAGPSPPGAGRPRGPARSEGPYDQVSQPPASPKIHHGSASLRRPWPPPSPPPRRISRARDGVMVRALTAEMMVEAAI